VDFTREPVIQSVITPRQGYRLVVRSSKSAGLEEHFVDAVEIVSFGNSSFFRSTERPKPFIVPVSDYEVLEVREPRIVLKAPAQGAIKVSSADKGRAKPEAEKAKAEPAEELKAARAPKRQEARTDRRRDRRRGARRRRGVGKDEQEVSEAHDAKKAESQEEFSEFEDSSEALETRLASQNEDAGAEDVLSTQPTLSTILPPPTTLIRDDLERLRKHEAYRGAFYDVESDDEETPFPTESIDYTESEISMKEGGDEEVPPMDPFRQTDEIESKSEFKEDEPEEERVLTEGLSDAKKNAE